jgi:Tfp pilus assembly protein FimT
MIELVVTMVLASIVGTLGILAMHNYLTSNRHASTAQSIRSALRGTGERAISEGRTYCLYFTATTWTTYKSDCSVAANKVGGTETVLDSSITLSSIAFPASSSPLPGQTSACPTAGRCAYFYPRGNALAGSLQVVRPGKTYTVTVEGLTGRVSVA